MNPKADDYKSILQLDKGYLKYKPVQDTCVSICLIYGCETWASSGGKTLCGLKAALKR